jgi:hypothetical protein
VGDFGYELLFDLSEGGLAVYGRLAALGRRSFPIKFRLPGDDDPITTRGEIAWTARNRTGIRFVDFSDAARLHLKHWIATKLPPGPAYDDDYKIDWSKRVYQSSAVRQEKWRPNYVGKAALVLGVSAALFLFGFELSRFHFKSRAKGEPASVNGGTPPADVTELSGQVLAAQPPANSASAEASTAAVSAQPSNATFTRGFLIQVGALKRQRNVDDLSSSLRQKGLPVIVSKNAADGIYRIVVGPYPDLSSAARVRNALKAQDIDGFITPWKRE